MQERLVKLIVRGVLGAAAIASVMLANAQVASSDLGGMDGRPSYAQIISADDSAGNGGPWNGSPFAG